MPSYCCILFSVLQLLIGLCSRCCSRWPIALRRDPSQSTTLLSSRAYYRTAPPSDPHRYHSTAAAGIISAPTAPTLNVSNCRQVRLGCSLSRDPPLLASLFVIVSVHRQETMMSKEHGMLLSAFLLFKFLSKDLIIPALIAYFIRGIDTLLTSCMFLCSVTLPPSMKRFLTKKGNYKEAVSWTPLTHISVEFIESGVVASIPGFFFCMWYAAKKYCLANNVLGISSPMQGIEMLSLGPFKTSGILLPGLLMHGIFWVVFTSVMLLSPITDAAWRSSLLTTGDTVIPGIFVALALSIAVPRCSKNRFFNHAFLLYAVGLTVIIFIMNWFQAVQGALQFVAPGVIGFVAVHCLWNREVKQDDTSHLMGKVWDWNMHGAKLKKLDGWVLHAANGDGERGEDDAIAIPEDRRDGPEDGSSGFEDHDTGLDDSGKASEDSDDEIVPLGQREPHQPEPLGQRAVQLLVICANFPICAINGYDGHQGLRIYRQREGEVQEEGMADLVPIGPRSILTAHGAFTLEVFCSTNIASDEGSSTVGPLIIQGWDVCDDDEIKEYRRTICAGPGRKLEITYLVLPNAIEANVEVRLKFKDLGSRSRAVYGKIKASATDYGNKSVHLFYCKRGTSWSFPSGSTSVLPLSPSMIALPCRRQLELHIEVDLIVITTCDDSQEEDKSLKFSLDFTREIVSQEREDDDDQVEVNIKWYRID